MYYTKRAREREKDLERHGDEREKGKAHSWEKHVLLKIFDGIAEAMWFGPCSYRFWPL